MLSESCFRPVDQAVSDVDRLIFQSPLVGVGEFRCPPTHPKFHDTGAIRNYCFVFPRTASVIEHDSGARFVGDQTRMSLYNAGQQYRRDPVSPEGDHSDYFVVSERVLREALAARGARSAAEADARKLFTRAWAPTRADVYLRQRQVFRAVRARVTDALEVESAVMGLLDDALDAEAATAAPRAPRPASRLVEQAQALLALRFADPLTLQNLAAALEVSAFHLCRVFRAGTGMSLHQYRDQIRLRAALDRLDGCEDITEVALDVGYCSHSHFTAAFRRAFGVPPSRARSRHT